ncbi:uncharacterized protein LOC116805284 [Drosophila grimshawi]|uniref:uncharacterized protein LOC116805284 n=1 Tax=Drosophila grimshawi TaxID=7222 RepID=UPI000C86E55D|nr:uncharacterized protein LOC116805284 [Drosophila grimshawi]
MNFDRKLQGSDDVKGSKKSRQDLHIAAQRNYLARQKGGEIQRRIRNLDRQFHQDILRLENSMSIMEVPEKSLAAKWISKLRAHQPNLSEANARNYILTYLLQSNPCKIFGKKPFNNPPSQNDLSQIKKEISVSTDKKVVQDLFSNSCDNGAFLRKLPVPRDGAFFIVHLHPNLI